MAPDDREPEDAEMTKTKTATKATKTAASGTDSTTRAQRNRVRDARALSGAELKAHVAKHKDAIRAVAAATNRKRLSAEAKKLIGAK
jgi:proline dehydrogenase